MREIMDEYGAVILDALAFVGISAFIFSQFFTEGILQMIFQKFIENIC